MTRTVSFTQMKDGSREDYLLLRELEKPHLAMTAERIVRELRHQGEETIPGYKVTRLDHALQSATRALRDGADEDWIVGALLHDIGDGLAPQNHDRFAAEILRPYVREEVTWVVEHHGAFQMVYYAHHYGRNQHERDRHKASPHLSGMRRFLRALGPGLVRPRLPGRAAGNLRADGGAGVCPPAL
jgi:predicted HD phosphohydrolase